MKYKQIFILFFLLSFSIIFGQENHPYQNGEKIINDKIEIYKNIDTLSYYSPLIATKENREIEYEVHHTEGEITIHNKEKELFGTGGFNAYKFVNKKAKKLLKIEYNQTMHLYKDENLKNYLNSEIKRITIFFNVSNKPDFAKVLENQYTSEKVISSQLHYLNLPEETSYYKSLESEKLINYIQKIVSDYK